MAQRLPTNYHHPSRHNQQATTQPTNYRRHHNKQKQDYRPIITIQVVITKKQDKQTSNYAWNNKQFQTFSKSIINAVSSGINDDVDDFYADENGNDRNDGLDVDNNNVNYDYADDDDVDDDDVDDGDVNDNDADYDDVDEDEHILS